MSEYTNKTNCMQDKKDWVICPDCGKRLLKYHGGAGDSTYEIKCSGKNCGKLVTIYSAGQTFTDKITRKNSEGYADYTAYEAISRH